MIITDISETVSLLAHNLLERNVTAAAVALQTAGIFMLVIFASIRAGSC